MENYIMVNNQKIELTEDQVRRISEAYGGRKIQLKDIPVGDLAVIAGKEFLVLEQRKDETVVILRDLMEGDDVFGKDNNYDGSNVKNICDAFAEKMAEAIGEENLVAHSVDLTSNDGLKDYGTVICRASLLTAELYRKYVLILDKDKPERWWWLATPWSTEAHGNSTWVLCVSPSGCVIINGNYFSVRAVRPFCILKSDIFVSFVQ